MIASTAAVSLESLMGQTIWFSPLLYTQTMLVGYYMFEFNAFKESAGKHLSRIGWNFAALLRPGRSKGPFLCRPKLDKRRRPGPFNRSRLLNCYFICFSVRSIIRFFGHFYRRMLVMKDTTSTYWVQACMYQKRNCIDQWKMLLTMYGYCLQLKPERQEPSENSQSIN